MLRCLDFDDFVVESHSESDSNHINDGLDISRKYDHDYTTDFVRLLNSTLIIDDSLHSLVKLSLFFNALL